MHHSKRFGCQVYPLLFLITLAIPGLIAQNPTGNGSQRQHRLRPSRRIRSKTRFAWRRRLRPGYGHAAQQRTQRVIQDTYSHKFEVYGGGGYTRFRPGLAPAHQRIRLEWGVHRLFVGANGDYCGLARLLRNRVHHTQSLQHLQAQHQQYTFMAGPQYRFVRREHWAISGQVLVGGPKAISMPAVPGFLGTFVGLWSNGTNFSLALGVPIDYNLSPGLAVRLQPGYWFTTFGGTTQVKNLGFNCRHRVSIWAAVTRSDEISAYGSAGPATTVGMTILLGACLPTGVRMPLRAHLRIENVRRNRTLTHESS